MSFSISFLDEPLRYPYDDATVPAAVGRLAIGDSQEYFEASLYEWAKEDYKAQWRNAIKLLLTGTHKTALIVTYGSPEVTTHLEWWPMYRVGGRVFLQDHLLFYDQLTEPFSLQNAFSFVRGRQTTDEDGRSISEWSVSLSEVQQFADMIGG